MPSVPQNAFTIVAEIEAGRAGVLKGFLDPIGRNINGKEIVKFCRYHQLHFCCFVVIDEREENPGAPPVLLFEGNVDGEIADFLEEMAKDPFLPAVFAYCKDSPRNAAPAALVAYLLERDRGYDAYYISHPGWSVREKQNEAKLMTAIQDFLDGEYVRLRGMKPEAVHAEIQKHVRGLPDFAWTNTIPDDLLRVRFWRKIARPFWRYAQSRRWYWPSWCWLLPPMAAWAWLRPGEMLRDVLGLLLSSVTLVGLYVGRLRSLEKSDVQDIIRWDPKRRSLAQVGEDRQSQNHLTSLSYVKPGFFRLWTLRAVLRIINIAARYTQVEGNLTGIVTIHFARWVILDGGIGGGKRLLFLSNYDGSWEKYLGEFIDVASRGLTAIWSNTGLGKNRGFPDTRFLFAEGGARDEQRFKAMARNSQLPEQIWYSAYPTLSVTNVGNNKAVREGLYDEVPSAQAWLRRF